MSDHSIKFRFNALKAAQTAFKVLSMAGGRLNYMVLVKLLYLADREAIMKLECPITGDRLVSLPHGPILSHVLDLIKNGPIYEQDEPWFRAISPPSGYDVEKRDNLGDSELSNAEEQILLQTFADHGKKTWQELSKFTHELPEWTDPEGSSAPIAFETILLLAGKSQDDLARIRKQIAVFRQIDKDIAAYSVEEAAESRDCALAV
jgi:hypothetical protein